MDGIEEQEMKGVIYKLYSDEGNMVYIGSTLDFKRRMREHARQNKGCNSKFLFKYYGTVKVVKLEERNFMNRKEMLELEFKYINETKEDENVNCVNVNNPLNLYEYLRPRVYVDIDVKGMADEYEAYKKMKDSKVVNFKEECSFYEMVDGKCFDLKSYYTCEYCNVLVPYLARHCETERHKMAKMMVENGKSITVDVKDEGWIDENGITIDVDVKDEGWIDENGITIDVDVKEMDDGWKERLKVMDEENGITLKRDGCYGLNIPKYVSFISGGGGRGCKFVYDRRYKGIKISQQLSGSSVTRCVADKYREMMCRYSVFVENGLMDKMKEIDEWVGS